MSKLILHSIYDVQMSPLKGKSTRKVAIANGTCVSFCNQPKAHFGLPWPGYAPGTIAVNVTWMERGFNAGQRHGSIYPSIFNRLRAIEILVGNCNFFLPSLHLTPPYRVAPRTIAVNVTLIEREFNAC